MYLLSHSFYKFEDVAEVGYWLIILECFYQDQPFSARV